MFSSVARNSYRWLSYPRSSSARDFSIAEVLFIVLNSAPVETDIHHLAIYARNLSKAVCLGFRVLASIFLQWNYNGTDGDGAV